MDFSVKDRFVSAFKNELAGYRDKASRLHCEYLLGTMTLDEYRKHVDLLDTEEAVIFADLMVNTVDLCQNAIMEVFDEVDR